METLIVLFLIWKALEMHCYFTCVWFEQGWVFHFLLAMHLGKNNERKGSSDEAGLICDL